MPRVRRGERHMAGGSPAVNLRVNQLYEVTLAQMALEGGGAERHAARLGDQLGARQQRSLAVNLGAEPIEHRGEFAAADLFAEIRQRMARCGEELGGDQRAHWKGAGVSTPEAPV